jgi:hypothetical protein
LRSRACSAGKIFENTRERPRACDVGFRYPPKPLRAKTVRFSRTVKLGKILRSCGTNPTPSRATAYGGKPADIAIIVPNAPTPRLQITHDCEDGRGFTGAIAAKEAYDFAGRDKKRYALQNMTFAVISVDVFRFRASMRQP